MPVRVKMLLALAVSIVAMGGAHAGIIAIGSTLTFGGNNLPGDCTDTTCSDTVTFSSTPVLIDNGALSLYMTQAATGPNGEWDVWNLATTDGSPLAGHVGAFWSVVMGYTLTQPVYFDAVVDQWTVDGTPVSPIADFGGICCAADSNPSPISGAAYYHSGFSAPLAAGLQSGWQQVFISPYSFIANGGVDPGAANDFHFALHFTLQNPRSVPEPGSLPLIIAGLLGLGIIASRPRRRHART
jgi:hypothetical protein